jgi:flagellar biosynthesis protein FlhA
MAIEAELNSGAIDAQQAREQRKDVSEQADFYGAMDGASKFVRGDAIAGVLITLINIFGGLW